MKTLARLIARVLFALRIVRPHHLIFAWLAVLTFARTPAYSALATFIAADGNTQPSWTVAGPGGGTLNGSANTLTLAANNTLAGAAGTGQLAFGSMTGGATLPTGNLSWSAAATKTLTLAAAGNASVTSSAGTLVCDAATVSVGGTTATEVDIGNSLTDPTINIGGQTAIANGVINLGPASFATTTGSAESVSINTGTTGGLFNGNFSVQSSTFCMNEASTDFLLLGGNTPSGSTTELLPTGVNVANGLAKLTSSAVTIGTGTAAIGITTTGGSQMGSAGVGWDLSVAGIGIAEISGVGFGPVVNPNTLACGTGGTQVVAANTFGVVVTTGTLTSNCILDFATNAYSGLYLVDLSGATPGASFGIQFKNGSATNTYLSSGVISGTLALVWTHGANTLAVSY